MKSVNIVWISSPFRPIAGLHIFTHSRHQFMKSVAQQICDKMPDYHNFNDFAFTPNHVLNWVGQFDAADRSFVLDEFLHILNHGIYLTEDNVRQILIKKIVRLTEVLKQNNPITFLRNTEILRTQPKENSQGVLLKILDEEVQKHYKITLNECGTLSKKYAIYFDDVLATNKTVHDDCEKWLRLEDDGSTNLSKVLNGEKILIISLLCKHTWGTSKLKWRLKKDFSSDVLSDKIVIGAYYTIENHPTIFGGQRFNFVYPIKEGQPKKVLDYFETTHSSDYLCRATYDEKYCYRNAAKPKEETFFSSPSNRVRFENIFLHKGIDILNDAATLQINQRPLGMTNPTKKTFGTGTLFFTWRNISNTTPIVFWWKSANWQPLFELINRGN